MEWERHFEHCSGDRSDKHLEIWNISLVPSCLSKIASLGNLPSQRTEPLRHTPSLQSSLWFFSCMCLFGKSQIAESSFFQWSWCQRNPFQKNPPVYGNPIFVKSADIILGFSKIIFSRDLKGESLPDPRGCAARTSRGAKCCFGGLPFLREFYGTKMVACYIESTTILYVFFPVQYVYNNILSYINMYQSVYNSWDGILYVFFQLYSYIYI